VTRFRVLNIRRFYRQRRNLHRHSFSFLTLLFVFVSASAVYSQSLPASDPSLTRFESRYRSARTLSASFLEEYADNGQTTRKEAGTAYFLRPGKMRWDYEAPEKNLFLVDGKYAWFFAPADRTASRMPAKSSEDWRTPLALLTTDLKLSRVCSELGPARDEKATQPENPVYRCVLRGSAPKQEKSEPRSVNPANSDPAASPQIAYFEVTPDGELARIVVREPAGIRIEFRFRNWQWDPPLDKSLFQFKPPMGVAIVNGVLPDWPQSRP
jgi:outer membrane lipoprotein carrier protein